MQKYFRHLTFIAVVLWTSFCPAQSPYLIKIVDNENGWPVPMVELRTTSNIVFVSDNAGVVAFDLPEMLGRETWVHINGNGYGVAKDGFGYEGVRIFPELNREITIRVTRKIIAKRLGRLTGSGLFAESQKCGLMQDWTEQGIVGCDTVRVARHNDRLHWVWGDTSVLHYPLGLFQALGATTSLSPLNSFQPPVQLRFDYFLDASDRPRNTCPVSGPGPTWLDGVVSLPDANGKTKLVCCYAKIKPPMDTYQTGLCVWNEVTSSFDVQMVIWNQQQPKERPPAMPSGHVTRWTDESKQEWLLFGDPFPFMRCKAEYESWSDSKQWEILEPQKSVPLADGKSIVPHRGSIAWNNYRKKWVSIFCETSGRPSPLGEIWYAEAERPDGPWGPAIKVLSHENYSFYNPRICTELVDADAKFLLFEGTYTQTFSNNPVSTPRYDYNQILYRLDLDELHVD